MATTKRLAISKANAQMVIAVSIASFVTVFSLIAAHAVFTQNQYNARVTKQKEAARDQLTGNIKAFDQLVVSYKKFDQKNPNLLVGSTTGTGDNDGTNSKLVLDALPSSYDFPALTSSLEKILSNQGFRIGSIGGTDDSSAGSDTTATTTSATTSASPIPFTFNITDANYDSTTDLVKRLERSIRPMQIDTMAVTGGGSAMTMNISAHTYYQTGTTVNITQKVVK